MKTPTRQADTFVSQTHPRPRAPTRADSLPAHGKGRAGLDGEDLDRAVVVRARPPAELGGGGGDVFHSDVLGGAWGTWEVYSKMTILEIITFISLGQGSFFFFYCYA